jgi:Icc-related predicted phosphoesterase
LRIAAVSDIHAPRHLGEFREALKRTTLEGVDLFLLPGDVVHNNQHTLIPQVVGLLRARYSGPIYACPGNNEFDSSLEEIRAYPDVVWLDDEAQTITLNGTRLTLVGTKGVRDRVTPWLVWGVTPNPDVEATKKLYEERVVRLERLLSDNSNAPILVVFSHFAPTYQTLLGEEPSQYAELGTLKFEQLIERYRPALWVHGHAHKSKNTHTRIGSTHVYNVALPATHKITLIDFDHTAR